MKAFTIRSLSLREYIWIAAIVILAFVLFKRCNNTPVPAITTPTKVIKDTVRLIEADRKHLTDSFTTVLKIKEAANYQNESDFIKLLNENSELAVINERLQKEIVPDTCKGIVKKYQDAYGNYEAQTNRTIEQAKKSLIGLSQTVQTQKKFLESKDELYNRLKRAADTCIANSEKYEKYIKKVSPKRELGLVVSGINDFSVKSFKPAAGVGLSWRNKRGLQFVGTYYTNQTGSISIIKTLAKF